MTIYDSRHALCKSPFGAVPAGEEIIFRIYSPKLHLTQSPRMLIYEMDHWDAPESIPMSLAAAEPAFNTYACTFRPAKPALYAYCFQFHTPDGPRELRRGADGTGSFDQSGQLWQLTVYDPAMKAPDFFRGGTAYQIFPDRFCNSGEPKENIPYGRTLRADWGGVPQWRPNGQGEVTNSDYFGGDLRGIEQKLDYLASLGVTVIYLNPIFEAHSNHRYNTADYTRVDPLLGTNEDFRRLCRSAAEKGISIILDGVFSHTGSDSVYFNKNRRYGGGGAYNDPYSPWSGWYRFSEYPGRYESWWGFETLPNVNELDPSYLSFICGENGVAHQWLDMGAGGFRLDVADELPDGFLDALHSSIKSKNPEAVIIGEVWEDASNKISYGVRRRYLLGGQLDSAMNYPFQDAVLDYVRGGNHERFYQTVMQVLENYPAPAIECLLNSLGTHDTVRAITALAGEPLGQHDRGWQEQHGTLTPEQYALGRSRFALASIIQFGLPGVPCVYYGDEAGMHGYRDPFNRGCYPWGQEDALLVELIRALGKMRAEHPMLAAASFAPVTLSGDVLVFARRGRESALLFAVNRSASPQRIALPGGAELLRFGSIEGDVLAPLSGVVLECQVQKVKTFLFED